MSLNIAANKIAGKIQEITENMGTFLFVGGLKLICYAVSQRLRCVLLLAYRALVFIGCSDGKNKHFQYYFKV